MAYKVGDKVRILDVENIIGGETHWDNGDIVKVTKAEGRIWLERKKTKPSPQKPFLHDYELQYIELVSPKPTKNQRLTSAEQAISTLEQKVEAMQAEIDALKAAQKLDEVAETFGIKRQHAAPKSTPNEQRKAIIDEAKAFVENAQKRDYRVRSTPAITSFQKSVFFGQTDELVFHVNAEKRTVVAIIRTISGKHLVHKGIAKCAPDDVFNEHIGKAIALGRALGLDVERFEKAVQPSEVVVGMVVRGGCKGFYNANKTFTINGEHRDSDAFYYEEAKQYGGGDNDWILRNQIGVIVNDSEAKY